MTPNIPENTTAGVPAADAAPHITVEGFDSPVPEIVELAAPREGVPGRPVQVVLTTTVFAALSCRPCL